jgi:hypothetical protein
MEITPLQPPFTNLQAELLKLFARNLPDAQLIELRTLIGKFLLEKVREDAQIIWDEKGYSKEYIENQLYEQTK